MSWGGFVVDEDEDEDVVGEATLSGVEMDFV